MMSWDYGVWISGCWWNRSVAQGGIPVLATHCSSVDSLQWWRFLSWCSHFSTFFTWFLKNNTEIVSSLSNSLPFYISSYGLVFGSVHWNRRDFNFEKSHCISSLISALSGVKTSRHLTHVHTNFQLDFNKILVFNVAFVLWTCFKQVVTLEVLMVEAVSIPYALIWEILILWHMGLSYDVDLQFLWFCCNLVVRLEFYWVQLMLNLILGLSVVLETMAARVALLLIWNDICTLKLNNNLKYEKVVFYWPMKDILLYHFISSFALSLAVSYVK